MFIWCFSGDILHQMCNTSRRKISPLGLKNNANMKCGKFGLQETAMILIGKYYLVGYRFITDKY